MPFTLLVQETKDKVAEYRWHNGEQKPLPDKQPFYLEATGNEYSRIRDKFENIPLVMGTRCSWHGEMAVFIHDNL